MSVVMVKNLWNCQSDFQIYRSGRRRTANVRYSDSACVVASHKKPHEPAEKQVAIGGDIAMENRNTRFPEDLVNVRVQANTSYQIKRVIELAPVVFEGVEEDERL